MTKCAKCGWRSLPETFVHGRLCPYCLHEIEAKGRAPAGRRGPSKAEHEADQNTPVTLTTLEDEYRQSVPGHPLGSGMPPGEGFRRDGESHRDAWKRILRFEPCAYCGARAEVLAAADGESMVGSHTIDHIRPQASKSRRGIHDWTNYTAACAPCNVRKQDRSLLWFLYIRKISQPRKVQREAA